MLTYSDQCSANDDRNLVIHKSDTQRDDTKSGDSSGEHIFCEPGQHHRLTEGMVLTWVVYVADTATLKCMLRFTKTMC
jgi:hypothetical protein